MWVCDNTIAGTHCFFIHGTYDTHTREVEI